MTAAGDTMATVMAAAQVRDPSVLQSMIRQLVEENARLTQERDNARAVAVALEQQTASCYWCGVIDELVHP